MIWSEIDIYRELGPGQSDTTQLEINIYLEASCILQGCLAGFLHFPEI